MSMQIAATENGVAFSQASGTAQQVRIKAAEQKMSALKEFTASLPGSRESGADSVDALVDVNVFAEDLERISSTLNKKLKFTVDHESYEILIKVIDPETDEIVKVLPPEELRRLHHKIRETIGVLFNELI